MHSYPVSVFDDALRHDKKASGDKITIVRVESVGEYQLKTVPFSKLSDIIKEGVK
jgi:3-dehydroquinate synthetase